jgi:hypothetical protein
MAVEEIEDQLKELQHNVELVALGLDSLQRSIRAHAGMDELNMEMKAIRRCLSDLQPDLAECFTAIRCQLARDNDSKK